jgi:hypothetical protein
MKTADIKVGETYACKTGYGRSSVLLCTVLATGVEQRARGIQSAQKNGVALVLAETPEGFHYLNGKILEVGSEFILPSRNVLHTEAEERAAREVRAGKAKAMADAQVKTTTALTRILRHVEVPEGTVRDNESRGTGAGLLARQWGAWLEGEALTRIADALDALRGAVDAGGARAAD